MRDIVHGSTDQSVIVRFVDSTDGTPETGVTTATGGLALWYRRELGLKVAITGLSDLATLATAHADGGLLHISDGYYRIDPPDAAFASGQQGVAFGGSATGMVVIGCYIPLVAVNNQDAVRFGMTALPNAAAEAAGGLYTRGTGAGQINQPSNGVVDANALQVAGSATAGTNAKAFFDGTGYAGTGNTIPTVTTITNPVTTTERRVRGSAGINAAGLLTAHAWLTGPDGAIVNGTAATFELLDYDGTSIIGTGAWTTAPTETAAFTWYADKTTVTLVEGMAYRLRVVITAGSAYTDDIPLNAVA